MRFYQQFGRDNTDCSAATHGGACNRVLVATSEELDIIHAALSLYRTMLHEKARTECTGYSEGAIQVCVRKISVDTLLQAFDTCTVSRRNSTAPRSVPWSQAEIPR